MPVPHASAAVDRRLVRVVVADRIRTAIVDGTLEPGETLRDDELTAWIGVSRTPVREAVATLERERLVRTTPGRSTAVTHLDPVVEQQAAATLLALLQASVARAAARSAQIDPTATAAVVAASSATRSRRAAALLAWTRAADESGGNPVILRLADDLRPVVQRGLTLGSLHLHDDPGRAGSVVSAVVDAVAHGDATASRRACADLADVLAAGPAA